VELSLEDVVVPLSESLTSNEELPSNVGKGTVDSKMTGVSDGVARIPSRNFLLNDVANSSLVRWGLGRGGVSRKITIPSTNKLVRAFGPWAGKNCGMDSI